MNCVNRVKRAAGLGSVCLVFVGTGSLLGGCKGRENAVEDKGTDTAFLRSPSEMNVPDEKATLKTGPLFPAGVGSHWEMKTEQGLFKPLPGEKSVKITGRGTETIKVTGQTNLGGETGSVFEITAQANDGKKPVGRQEVYAVTKDGLYLLAAGSVMGRMTMSPPLPILAYPPKQGQALQWNGVLHYRNATVPASCVSRVSGVQTVKNAAFPQGVGTYRVDTIISTTLLQNGRSEDANFPTTRYLAPGVGVVRQKLIAGNQIVSKELKSFKIIEK